MFKLLYQIIRFVINTTFLNSHKTLVAGGDCVPERCYDCGGVPGGRLSQEGLVSG